MTTRSAGKNKLKKPLERTLGKAPIQSSKDEPFDLSQIQKPIETSIFGLGQVLSLVHTATDEVKNYISYECDILYECRVCRSIFRSLANFILHKRKYCQEKYSSSKNWKTEETCDEMKFCENNEDDNNSKTVTEKRTKSLSNVLDSLLNKQKNMILTENVLNENSNGSNLLENSDKCGILVLEKIQGCDNALFQTKKTSSVDNDHLNIDLMKSEVMEIHSILDNDEAILGPDGKILSSNKKTHDYLPKKDLMCTICDQKFSTKKTLSCHIKYKHNKNRLVYPCPECQDTLSNTWCVFRHLIKVHRKTPCEIKKLREVIHSSAIIKDQETSLTNSINDNGDQFKKKETESQHNQQWMDDFESANDLQMCGGCGRRFERKAALNAHSQICLKRIALCNSIKENNNKQVIEEVEEKSAKEKTKSNPNNISQSSTQTMKGSERRKPLVLRRNCRSNIRERNDYCANHNEKVQDENVITISDEEEIDEGGNEKEAEEEKNKTEDSKKKEPKTSELPVEIMKEIDSKIAEVIDNIKRKRLSAEEFTEDCDSGPEMAPFKKESTTSEEDEDCVIIDNNKQQQPKKDPTEGHKDVLEVIYGSSSTNKKLLKKLKDSNVVTDVNSNISTLKKCQEKKEDVSSSSSSSSSDSDVSSPPFEAFNKLESDDSSDSVKSASERKKLKLDEDGERLKVSEKNLLSERPKRSRTSTLHKDFLYDIVQNKRNNREISINNNNNKKKSNK